MTSPDATAGGARPGGGAPPAPDRGPGAAHGQPEPRPPAGGPARPEQSAEDTDAAWGEYPRPADDRLSRDRPPHWADY